MVPAATTQPESTSGALVDATPAPDEVVTAPPSQVALTFASTADASDASVRVFDETGARLAGPGPAQTSGTTVDLPLPPLGEGTFLVAWSTGDDSGGHVFRVDESGRGAVAARARVVDDGGGAALVAARIANAIGVVVLVGIVVVAATRSPTWADTSRFRRLLWGAWAVALVAASAGCILEAVRGDGLESRAGLVWLVRALLLGLSAPLVAWIGDRGAAALRSRPVQATATVVALALLGTAVAGELADASSDTEEIVAVQEDLEEGFYDLTLAPARPGGNEMHLYLFDERGVPTDVEEATIHLRYPPAEIGPISTPVLRAGPHHFLSYDFVLPFSGEWQVDISARTTEGEDLEATASVEVR